MLPDERTRVTSPDERARVILPGRLFTRALLRRGIFIWLGTRILFRFAGGLVADRLGPPSIFILPPTAIALSCLVGALGLLEARRRHEHLLLANLGVAQWRLWVIATLPALVAEMLVALVGHW
jgi:nitrate/nitrite transporter NarK